MKLRNIISIVTAGLFMMSACTDEELIDRSIPDSGVRISLTTKGVMTKAAADGYEHSTPDEIKINTCAIAFFDQQTNERVGFKYQSFAAASGNLNDGRAYYSVSDILVKGGSYNMLVLANSSLSQEAIQNAKTYSEFKALKETLQDQGAATFEAANLVKFGEQDVTISKGEANDIQVELTQLAARIDLSFQVNVPAEEVEEPVVEERWTMDDLIGIAVKNPGKYKPGSSEPGECKMHAHDGKWLYVPDNIRTTTITKKSWIFAISKVMISNVALKSNSFMETTETAENENDNISYLVKDFEVALSGGTATVPFYTYEKTFSPQENPLTVAVDGNLKYGTFEEKTIETFSAEYQWISDQGGGGWGNSGRFDKTTVISSDTKTTQEMTETIDNIEKSYKLVFNPTKSTECKTNGVVHGNLYDIVGTIDVNTREAKFNWTLKPWEVKVREVSVDIVDPAFLVVANTEMTMPNMTSISTMFQSSSPITISNIKVSNGTSYTNKEVTITNSEGNSGSINISSELPDNFVPKEFSFTVANKEGLIENVKVHQYPPLYIYSHKTGSPVGGSSGQNNKDMYIIKSLIADFSSFPFPDEFDELMGNGKTHEHKAKHPELGKQYTEYIRVNANLGYPATNANYQTVDNLENNMLVSPHFMLASQAGTITPRNYDGAVERCADYSEIDASNKNITYSDWRMPTLAEIYIIDILQNVKRCDVKSILEGEYYWSARKDDPEKNIKNHSDKDGSVRFMDARLPDGNDNTWWYNTYVRCVRDIKE